MIALGLIQDAKGKCHRKFQQSHIGKSETHDAKDQLVEMQ